MVATNSCIFVYLKLVVSKVTDKYFVIYPTKGDVQDKNYILPECRAF